MIKILKTLSMKTTLNTLAVSLCAFTLVGCPDDFDNPVEDRNFSTGELDTSTYVALGDSLTAGFANGALYRSGQINSFPNILAESFTRADGGGVFNQPLMSDDLGGFVDPTGAVVTSISNRLVLTDINGSLAPFPEAGAPTTVFGQILTSGPFNNMGIPGARSFHLVAPSMPGYGDWAGVLATPPTANLYFARFASGANARVITDAATQAPTFFTLWIGNNDILGYATGGGIGADSRSGYGRGTNDITDPSTDFAGAYGGIVNTLTAMGTNSTKGALINIPAITSIPFFTTVPIAVIPITDQETLDAANGAYTAYNAGLDAAVALIANSAIFSQEEADRRKITFSLGANPPVILDDTLRNLGEVNANFAQLLQLRQATQDDFILLTSASILGTLRDTENPLSVIGVGDPLRDGEILTADEAAEVEAARSAYNATIKSIADASENLIYVDMASLLSEVSSAAGFSFGTGTVTSEFATGGAFSLDGVHPTAKGYAIVANKIIDDLNAAFSADIPRVDPGLFTEVFYAP